MTSTDPKSEPKRKPNAKRKPADTRRSLGRLERILLLVPYCVANPDVSIEELSKRFGVTQDEIREDLELLFLCGLPDYTPADLIEVAVEEDRVSIRMADYFARPLRITRSEAIPLYLKGRALLDMLDQDADGASFAELAPLRSALDKLAAALSPQDGGVAELADRIQVALESGEAHWLPLLREAVTEHLRVDMEYYTFSRDALTRRQVDPYLVFASLGHWYVSGYCHLAVDRRIFRLDRIKTLALTETTFEPPPGAADDLPPPMLYTPGPEDAEVTLRVRGSVGVWLAEAGEFFSVESVKEMKGGRREIRFHTSAFPWLEKLLLRFGSDVEVVDPPELRDRLRQGAERILALYEPKRTPH